MKCLRKFAAAALGVLWLAPALAQERGAIFGVVEDAQTGQVLSGANLLLEETGQGTTSDTSGAFRLSDLPAGTYTLVASFVGYRTHFERLVVRAGQDYSLRLALQPEPIPLQQTLVKADPAAISASSSRTMREFDLRIRPKDSPQELLQAVPGLFAVRHAGGGKAEQIFMRGFDSGFGTDVAISVDGMPVNLVSHGHGQGYADLHFLIPEVVERMEVFKGPYFAEFGNLANAAQISFYTRRRLAQNSVRLERGGFHTTRGTVLYQLPMDSGENSAYFAGDFYGTDGPFEHPQDLRRLTLFAKVHRRLAPEAALTVEGGGTNSAWKAPGQIPLRAVASGRVTRWGSIDDAEGGSTARHNLNLTYRSRDEGGKNEFIAQAYLSDYTFKGFADYTFFLQDPIFGDMIEQGDSRWIAGLNSKYRTTHSLGPVLGTATLGGGFRVDDIQLELWQVVKRRRYWPLVDAGVHERNYSLWGQEEIVFTPAWRLILGLRGDYFTFDVEDRLEVGVREGVLPLTEYLKQLRRSRGRGKALHVPLVQPHASGVVGEGILSPKASLSYSPTQALDLFANFGTGFHSNDARSVVIGQFVREQWRVLAEDEGATEAEIVAILDTLNFDPRQRQTRILPRAIGGELGLRLRVFDPGRAVLRQLGPAIGHYPGDLRFHAPVTPLSGRLNLGASLWWIDVDDEFIYVAEVGTLEERGRTRRWGVDLEARLQLFSWLWADLDANWAQGRQRDAPPGKDRIPLAPRFTAAGGLTARYADRSEGRLQFRHLGDRPATADRTLIAAGYTLCDLSAAYHLGRYQLELAVENLFDVEWREVQFAAQSLLPWEGELVLRGPPPPPDLHFSPGNPRNLRFGISLFY